jgi:hypothetical protein
MFYIYIFFLDLWDVFVWTGNIRTLICLKKKAGKSKLFTGLHENKLFVYAVFI